MSDAAATAATAATAAAATANVTIPVLPTTEEQRRINNLFYCVCTMNYSIGLQYVVKLMHQVANGAANRAILQGISDRDYLQKLMTLPDDAHVNINAVTFDAVQLASNGRSLLRHWAAHMDEHSAYEVWTTFELLQRSGGVTLNAALLSWNGANAYALALHCKVPYWVNCLLSDCTLDAGWSVATTPHNRTPLMLTLEYSYEWIKECAPRLVQMMSDDAINARDSYGTTALVQTISKNSPLILEALLLRSSLNMNPTPSLRTATKLQSLPYSSAILSVFDKVATVFAVVPSFIHNALYDGFKITLPLPVCTIIYHYYRMPYPVCECNPALLAAAPTKHSPFCFCFPPP